ncbi:pectinesterase/pectinesterase inhibitor PPE8B [Trifolium medium]|uniref:Pectinesterase/pectinesterase inhibitor PPE8B n=1 Tax=Trifolium medium TaxID=97028 RepID=A0A392Q8M4_9FABA|nr:pectinesterase/pectinesterase inhibitor PPE8B [Trifolium medium]
MTKIDIVNSLIKKLLNKVKANTISHDDFTNQGCRFPSWVSPRVEKLLMITNAKQSYDVVVVVGGSGNFTNVMDAVNSAPDSSRNCYIIFVKKGIYTENVEINRANIVIVGEGMDATIITSSLSSAKNGLTTYKTATFGKDTQTPFLPLLKDSDS